MAWEASSRTYPKCLSTVKCEIGDFLNKKSPILFIFLRNYAIVIPALAVPVNT